MTITESARLLLNDFSPEERGIPDVAPYTGRNAAVQAAQNAALQELFGEGGAWVRYDEEGVVVNVPTAVSVAVTNGSDAATITGWASWMAGCTIQIGGSEVDNQIRNASSSAVLKFPYDGPTGNQGAIVYHNSITVADSILRILDPVMFNRRKLSAMTTSGVSLYTRTDDDFGYDHRFQNLPTPDSIGETIGTPLGYSVETWSPSATAQPSARIALVPAPGEGGFLEYRAMLAPPVVTDIASTSTLPIPQQWMESIFQPIARKHLSSCPFFRAVQAMDEISRAYQQARQLLSKLDPGANQGRLFKSMY